MQTQESQAYQVAFNRAKSWSNENLLSVWEAAASKDASPKDGWGTYIGDSWVVLVWDDWMEVLYSEISRRGIKI